MMPNTYRRPRSSAARPRRASRIGALAGTSLVTLMSLAAVGTAAAAPAPVPLGTAATYALLAGSTITNTGVTTIFGNIGLCCTGTSLTGFGPGADQVVQTNGAQYVGPLSPAATAQADLDVAYANAAGRAVTNTVGVNLSLSGTFANPLLPGVYQSTSRGDLEINNSLYLNFQGDPNAVFIFQGNALRTAANAAGSVFIINGGSAPSACNIYWQLADATQGVTLGTGSAFKGTTMSLGQSTLTTGATVEGRILTRRSKQVTLDTNTIIRPTCAAAAGSGGGGTPTPPVTTGGGGTTTPPVTTGGGGTTTPPVTVGGGAPPATPSPTKVPITPTATPRRLLPKGPAVRKRTPPRHVRRPPGRTKTPMIPHRPRRPPAFTG